MQKGKKGIFVETWKSSIAGKESQVWEKIQNIGGENGWYFGTFLWKIRGRIDLIFGGIGFRKGRPKRELEIGDQVDFWRVVNVDNSRKHLKMKAEMKLPGKVWITFEIKGDQFIQEIDFQPQGIFGRLYWIMTKPIHHYIFSGMYKAIKKF
ncbi:DUF2867 domain-containing protein [Belliella sp. DSM 107340]|uniref:DUF2867 domain-containing protein n=1 Tax=Belliella calami TaxID=2923436 RepID=A0ABS9UNE3_9BACT|nr:DUF2867 domain-containing protein [Belliella calami]MCH7397705.1 DUF2867 domain-containing protein [Belliella calami]